MALPDIGSIPQSGSIAARWKLNESSGNRADSVGANTLTDNGTCGSISGQFSENAVDFIASNSESLSISDNAALSITGDLTYACWVKLDNQTGSPKVVLSKYESGQTSYLFRKEDGDNSWVATLVGGSTKVGIWTQAISNDTWYHVCWVYDASAGECDFYFNGAKVGSTVTGCPTSLNNTTSAVWIGALYSGTWYMDGNMQDAILWNTELTGSEVLDLYNAYFPVASGQYMSLNRGWW